MLVHLAALARAARQIEAATEDERNLLRELEGLLALRLVDPGSGALTAEALRLAPAAGAALAAADSFFELAETLGGGPGASADASAPASYAHLAPVGSGPVRAVRR